MSRAGMVRSARDVLARAVTVAIRCVLQIALCDRADPRDLDCAIRRQFVDRDAPQVEDQRVCTPARATLEIAEDLSSLLKTKS